MPLLSISDSSFVSCEFVWLSLHFFSLHMSAVSLRLNYKEVSGHLVVYIVCFLCSYNLTTFPEMFHEGFTSSHTNTLFTIDNLKHPSLSTIKYIINTLPEFHFSNFLDLEPIVHEPLPFYLSSSVHYPSFPAPLILVISIPLCIVHS